MLFPEWGSALEALADLPGRPLVIIDEFLTFQFVALTFEGLAQRHVVYALWSRSGYTPELREVAEREGVLLFTPEDMVHPSGCAGG